ncbi:MAG: hypothetical protein HY537_14235 [Deltaproteobacteria bacterium]|nr:hypothetical protein [Deltaproteobacteria bacterium]
MRFRIAAITVYFLSAIAPAQGREIVLISSVLKAKDSKTSQGYVQMGSKARVYPRIIMRATGAVRSGMKSWMAKQLPSRLTGYLVREDKISGNQVRFQPMAMNLNRKDIFCTMTNSPDDEICQAEYLVSGHGAIDIQAGDSGEHQVMLKVVPPQGLPLRSMKYASSSYFVVDSKPKLSGFAFSGLPQQ